MLFQFRLCRRLYSRKNSIYFSASKCLSTKPFINEELHDKKVDRWSKALNSAQLITKVDVGDILNIPSFVINNNDTLNNDIKDAINSGHPVINTISQFCSAEGGQRIRLLIVLLISQATNLSQTLVSLDSKSVAKSKTILPTQKSIAEITEMIHIASLFHDNVADPTFDITPSSNIGNKMATLGGDFLLAQSSLALSRLNSDETVELIATSIGNIVEGKVISLEDVPSDQASRLAWFLENIYLRSASLFANSCKAAALVGGSSHFTTDLAYEFGKSFGTGYQLAEDLQIYKTSLSEKSDNNISKLNWNIAPIFFAAERFPEINDLINRNFSLKGDIFQLRQWVENSNSLEQVRNLIQIHCEKAVSVAKQFPQSEPRDALIELSKLAIDRVE